MRFLLLGIAVAVLIPRGVQSASAASPSCVAVARMRLARVTSADRMPTARLDTLHVERMPADRRVPCYLADTSAGKVVP